MALTIHPGGRTEPFEQAPDSGLWRPRYDEGVLINPQRTYGVEGWALARGVPVHWSVRFPEELAYDGLWHFMNGYMARAKTSIPFQEAGAQAGFATVVVDPLRKDNGNIFVRSRNVQKAHADAHVAVAGAIEASPEIRKKMPNGSTINLRRRVLLPHSMSGLVAPRVAEITPDRVEGIINLQAVGYGQPKAKSMGWKMLTGLPGSARHEIVPAVKSGNLGSGWEALWDEAKYVGTDFSRTFFEGRSCLKENVTERVQRLRERIWVGYLAAKYDILVPEDPAIAEFVDLYRVMENAGHMAEQVKPEEVVREIATMQAELQTDR